MDPNFHQADREDSDQTGRMPRLIVVLAGHAGHYVGFVILGHLCLIDASIITFGLISVLRPFNTF